MLHQFVSNGVAAMPLWTPQPVHRVNISWFNGVEEMVSFETKDAARQAVFKLNQDSDCVKARYLDPDAKPAEKTDSLSI